MKFAPLLLAVCALLLATPSASAHDDAIACTNCKQWNKPQTPFNIHGSTYYVGTAELSAILIAGKNGHILLDGALPQSAPLIAASIRQLGFRVEDIKLILNSHEHFDHAGGLPALQRMSGAQVVASPAGAAVLESGTIATDDPQYTASKPVMLAKIAGVRTIADGETLRLGDLAVTAHFTPGHAPGGITWTWRSCAAEKCVDVVYADSVNPVSRDGFYFTGNGQQPDRTAPFRATLAKLAALPCDIIVSVHPGFTDTFEKLARHTPERNAFVDPGSCKAYVEHGHKALAKRIARELEEKQRAAK